jgi:hypothetical protein
MKHFIILFVVAIFTFNAYAFMDKWLQMPGQMMQQVVIPMQSPSQPCNCTCNP